MGVVIERQFLSSTSVSLKPVLYVKPAPEIESKAISVSLSLSSALLKASPKMRTLKMETFFLAAIKDIDHPVVTGLDILFNPAYEIDVLMLLRNACKKKEFSVIWPGEYRDGFLYYAEEGYPDYKAYKLSDYDITVIL